MSTLRFEDDPWRRLPWTAVPAVALTLLSLMGFLRVIEQPVGPSSAPPPAKRLAREFAPVTIDVTQDLENAQNLNGRILLRVGMDLG